MATFGDHDKTIDVGNGSAVAAWSPGACDSVALVEAARTSAATTGMRPLRSFWVAVVDASEFMDIGFCSAKVDMSGATWAGHQLGQAFLYRSSGLFADSFVAGQPPCGKGTACSQGVAYGKPFAMGGNASASFSNVTAMQLSDTELEFFLDGVSQGSVSTKMPMPSDLVGCASACPKHNRARGDAALALRRCARDWQ
jgi:hypothetical protein